MGFLGSPLVHLIPRYLKLLPALLPLYAYLYNSAWACVSTNMTNTLNALGIIKTTFKLMVMWTALTWVLMPVLGIYRGYLGVSLAVALIATSSIVTVIAVRRQIRFSLPAAFRTSLISAFVLSLSLFFLTRFATNLTNIVFISLAGGLIYFASVILLEGRSFLTQTISYFKGHA